MDLNTQQNFVNKLQNSELDETIDLNLSTSQSYYSFDDILSKIGFGKYNIGLFFMMGLVGMVDGSETLCLSLIIPILQNQWQIGKDLESILGSVVYGGYFVGAVFSGQLADRFGRRKPLIYVSIFTCVFSLLSAFSQNVYFFIVFRGLFASGVGCMIPISFVILAENTPISSRGKFLTLIGINYAIGELFTIIIAYFTLTDLQSGKWRELLGWSTIPAILVTIASTFFVHESPRFDVIKGNYEIAFQNINKMAKYNGNKNYFLTEEEKKYLKIWSKKAQMY